ncbi:MAG: hypothetical protein CM1200mP36_11540 [Gammaproteobacteria bacterium]|nr:MAG: hypothetical protein CM1200mP36_11540 [Gammaproteobacteria bacterium]
MPLVSSMDHVGPITRCVGDAPLVLQAIGGPDHGDPLTLNDLVEDFSGQLEKTIEGMVVGVPRRYFFEGGDPEVIEVVEKSLAVFSELGAKLREVTLPDCDVAYEAANATFSEIVDANGDALAQNPHGFSAEFKKRYQAMAKYRGADYEAAQAYRVKFKRGIAEVMQHCDVLATPTSTVAAAPIEKRPPNHAKERRKNACIFDFTGQPSISVPCGFTREGLPVGLMLSGRVLEDSTVLRFARRSRGLLLGIRIIRRYQSHNDLFSYLYCLDGQQEMERREANSSCILFWDRCCLQRSCSRTAAPTGAHKSCRGGQRAAPSGGEC